MASGFLKWFQRLFNLVEVQFKGTACDYTANKC